MIAFVRGTVAGLSATGAVVEVGGVGVELQCTPRTLSGLRPGAAATLPTTLVVREDSLTLFGFADEHEKAVFELVQTASGVGPKVAQAMLAVLQPDEVRTAIRGEDVRALTTVPGIGQKGAQRIILELKDKVGPSVGVLANGPSSATAPSAARWRDQVHAGLVGLGWSTREAADAVDAVAADEDLVGSSTEEPDVAVLLRAALRALSPR